MNEIRLLYRWAVRGISDELKGECSASESWCRSSTSDARSGGISGSHECAWIKLDGSKQWGNICHFRGELPPVNCVLVFLLEWSLPVEDELLVGYFVDICILKDPAKWCVFYEHLSDTKSVSYASAHHSVYGVDISACRLSLLGALGRTDNWSRCGRVTRCSGAGCGSCQHHVWWVACHHYHWGDHLTAGLLQIVLLNASASTDPLLPDN